MQMFTTCLQIAASNHGLRLQVQIEDVQKLDLESPRPLFAKLTLSAAEELPTIEFGFFTNEDLVRRKTSRRPNLRIPVPDSVLDEIRKITSSFGHQFHVTGDQQQIEQVLRQDVRALFQDLKSRGSREELKPLLRLGLRDTGTDGLHYRAMGLSRLQMAMMKHAPWAIRLPGMQSLLERNHMQRLGHCEKLGFICGDFWDREASLKAGEMLIKMWLTLSRHNIHIHPFGNLVTNHEARYQVESMIGAPNLWFTFRLGYTQAPVRSSRLPVDEILI
jgi:hypothetical protein